MAKNNLYSRMSPDEFKKGAIFSLVNAYQLYGDAMIMDSLERLPRVYSFTKLALEEAAKSLMLFEIYIFKKSNFPNYESSPRYNLIIKGVDDHNPKTEYALNFLLSKQREFINFYPVEQAEDSPLHKECEEIKLLIEKVKKLDNKKNTSLYTSIVNNKFLPPFQSTSQEDINEISHRTFQLLIRAKQTIITDDDDEYYKSIGLDFDLKERLDPNLEARNMHKLKVTYLNHIEKIKMEYPEIKFDNL